MIENIVNFLAAEFSYSIIVFLTISLLSKLFTKQTALTMYGLWTLVLVRLILPPSLGFNYSLRSIFEKLATSFKPEVQLNSYFGEGIVGSTHQVSQISEAVSNSAINWQILIFFAWILGMVCISILYLVKIKHYNRVLKTSSDCKHQTATQFLSFWKNEFGVKRHVQLVGSEYHIAPFTKGIFKPVIFIPTQIIKINNSDLISSVIAHEMAHIKRKDARFLKFQTILQIIYFFNPVAWLANLRINYFRELICDRMVLNTGKITKDCYGESLLRILNMRLSSPKHIQLYSGIGCTKLKSRIHNILEDSKMKGRHSVFSLIFILVVALFVLPLANKGDAKSASEPGVIEFAEPEFGLPLKSGELKVRFGVFRKIPSGERKKHIGIDIAAKKGTEVYSVQEGKVEKVTIPTKDKMKKGYGKYILINHGDGLKSLYSHLSEILVSEGSQINLGHIIGKVGNTGQSTGPHLHFEVIKDGVRVDPELYSDFNIFSK